MSYKELFKVQNLPVFQNKMFTNRKDAVECSKGDLCLVQNMETGLVFNSLFDSSLLEYDASYQNEQAYSKVFQKHLEDVEVAVRQYFFGKTLIEVGCGKGYFLEFLHRSGYDITGIDPAYEGSNPRIIKDLFKSDLGIRANGVLLRHVLEHMADPFAFLTAISEANGGHGKVYIEVPCFDWICDNNAWFDIFYEHVNYFRTSDFYRMFGRVYESGHIFGGQYLYIIADLATLQKPKLIKPDTCCFPSNILSKIDSAAKFLKGRHCAIWGASSKGVIFALYMQRAGIQVDWVVDINPIKQGKYMASSGIKVSSPDEAMRGLDDGDIIFVMNSNYLSEIIELSNNKFNYIGVDSYEF